MDLEQLRRHLDEDERVAQAAAAVRSGEYGPGSPELRALSVALGRFGNADRALRWVRAAREILDRHRREDCDSEYCTVGHCRGCNDTGWPCPTVLSVMSVYGDTDGVTERTGE